MKDDERLVEALAPIIDPVPWEPRWDDDPRGPKARAESLEWTRDLIARINASGIAWVAPVKMTEEMKSIGANHIRGCRNVGAASDQQTAQIVWGMERLTYIREQGVVTPLPGPDVNWERDAHLAEQSLHAQLQGAKNRIATFDAARQALREGAKNLIAELEAARQEIERLRAALYKIAYEPFGSAEATDAEVLFDIGLEARAALAACADPPVEESDRSVPS